MKRLPGILLDTARGFFADEALVRGASIAYFTLFSLAPILVIAVAVSGLVLGDEAATGGIRSELRGLLGDEAAAAVETMVQRTSLQDGATLAGAISFGMLLFAASGTFGALQSALNAVWKAETPDTGISALVKAKLAALGLVAATAFLALVSLMASAGISALGGLLAQRLPGGALLARVVELTVSFALLGILFAAIYKVLPDRKLAWRDVMVGAAATSALFMIGKLAIGLYLGHAAIGSAYGAAGSLVVVLVWVYYSALIFLLGAEFTRAWANARGSRQAAPVSAEGPQPSAVPRALRSPPAPPEPPASSALAAMAVGAAGALLGLRLVRVLVPARRR